MPDDIDSPPDPTEGRSVSDSDSAGEPTDLIEAVAEEFLAARRRGEEFSLGDLIARHPDQADAIREVFPALRLLEATAIDPVLEGSCDAEAPEIGGFRIVRELGHGGMGLVYEAVQVSLSRRVALKVLPAHVRLDSRLAQRFEREAQAAARLHHPNIVPIFEIGECEGLRFYAMQLIDGCSLDHVLRQVRQKRDVAKGEAGIEGETANDLSAQLASRLLYERIRDEGSGEHLEDCPRTDGPERVVEEQGLLGAGDYHANIARVGLQAARAIAYAHGEGVLHRDLKPSNIILDRGGRSWVADFGLARVEGSDGITHSGDVIGTPRYLAPESLGGWYDPRTDVWGLGVTLYELLATQPAFRAESRPELVRRIALEAPAPLRKIDRGIPRDLETIVLAAMEKDPQRRYPSASALADDLDRFLRGLPILACRTPLSHRVLLFMRRNRLAAAVAGGALVVLIVLLGIWGWRETRARSRLEKAHTKLIEALGRETAARTRTEAARRLSDENFQLALDAVWRMQLKFGGYRFAGEPHLERLRRELLADAAAFYREFLSRRSGDPNVGHEAGYVEGRLGQIEALLDHPKEAESALLEAERILRTPSPEPRSARNQRIELATVLMEIGRLFEVQKRFDDAEEAFRESVERANALVENTRTIDIRLGGRIVQIFWAAGRYYAETSRHPMAETILGRGIDLGGRLLKSKIESLDMRLLRSELVACYQARAGLLRRNGRLAEAHRDLREARKTIEPVAHRALATPEERLFLPDLDFEQAAVLRAEGQPGKAEASYRRAIAGFESLINDFPSIGWFRYSAAEVRVFLGLLLQETGQRNSALSMVQDAIEQMEALVDTVSPTAAHLQRLATAWLSLGIVHWGAGRMQEAETAYRTAIGHLESLGDGSESVEKFEDAAAMLALSRGNLGLLLGREGRLQEAVGQLRESVERYTELHEGNPRNLEYLEKYLLMAGNLTGVVRAQGRLGEAEEIISAAYDVAIETSEANPDNALLLGRAALVAQGFGNLEKGLGRLDEAADLLDDSVAFEEQRLDLAPDSLQAISDLAASLNDLGLVEARRSHQPEALDLFDRAISLQSRALDRDPGNRFFGARLACHWTGRGEALACLGSAAEAVAAARRALRIAPEDAETLFDVAGVFSRCAALVDSALAREYENQAVGFLQQAFKQGMRSRERLKEEPRFERLRKRADFQQLLEKSQ